MLDNRRLVTEAAAEILGVTRRFLQARRCRGGGPVFIRLGRNIRYQLADRDQWIEDRRATSTVNVTLAERPAAARALNRGKARYP